MRGYIAYMLGYIGYAYQYQSVYHAARTRDACLLRKQFEYIYDYVQNNDWNIESQYSWAIGNLLRVFLILTVVVTCLLLARKR